MALIATRLLRIELTVSDARRAAQFYTAALGFELVSEGELAASLAELLGARRVHEIVLRRLGQALALHAFEPAGAPYPADPAACDQSFQHFALPTSDIAGAVARLGTVAPISRGGPQHLPRRSGGATAFKFRDPDGHPLELIQLPDAHLVGIDHSAIVVADAARSIAFYQGLGLQVAARQINSGPEQDRLDGLEHASVEVVALRPPVPVPHVELLAYRTPPVRPATRVAPADIAGTRLVFEAPACPEPTLIADPDGHWLLLRGA